MTDSMYTPMDLQAKIGLQIGSLTLEVDLEVSAGSGLAVLGPNGAGKSTMLRALAGLHPIDTGRIALTSRSTDAPGAAVVFDDPAAGVFLPPADRHIGMVFQDYALFAQMSVLENVAFGLRATGTSARAAREIAAGWLERVGLREYAAHRPAMLSGGQAQRVALARALANSPQMLLLDEPLAALDVGTRATVRRDLRALLADTASVRVLVTHDPVDAYALADTVAIIEQGRIVQQGSLAEVTAHPRSRYVAELVGINLLRGTVAGGVLTTTEGAAVVVADAPEGPVFATIRPQAVTLRRADQTGDAARVSARNAWPGVVTGIDRLGDRARVSLHGAVPLTAEITLAALTEMHLAPGDQVIAIVKATEIAVSPA